MSIKNRGDALDNDVTKTMGSQYVILVFSARVIDMNAGHVGDGITFQKGNGFTTFVRELSFTPFLKDGYTCYEFERPRGEGPITLHRFCRGVLGYYGGNETDQVHHRIGGILYGVLEFGIGPFEPAFNPLFGRIISFFGPTRFAYRLTLSRETI